MRERAQEISGTFTVDARPGEGTTISATLPIAASNVRERTSAEASA
jgi:nitrate/nitrite-specific signal transduction histidine kinase